MSDAPTGAPAATSSLAAALNKGPTAPGSLFSASSNAFVPRGAPAQQQFQPRGPGYQGNNNRNYNFQQQQGAPPPPPPRRDAPPTPGQFPSLGEAATMNTPEAVKIANSLRKEGAGHASSNKDGSGGGKGEAGGSCKKAAKPAEGGDAPAPASANASNPQQQPAANANASAYNPNSQYVGERAICENEHEERSDNYFCYDSRLSRENENNFCYASFRSSTVV